MASPLASPAPAAVVSTVSGGRLVRLRDGFLPPLLGYAAIFVPAGSDVARVRVPRPLRPGSTRSVHEIVATVENAGRVPWPAVPPTSSGHILNLTQAALDGVRLCAGQRVAPAGGSRSTHDADFRA